MSEKLTRTRTAKTYQLAGGKKSNILRARWTGEMRPPRKGEWYLSGAVIEAYQAPNDLTTPYYIAELVGVKKVTTYAPHTCVRNNRAQLRTTYEIVEYLGNDYLDTLHCPT